VSAPRRVGRPRQCPDDVRKLVVQLHREGLSLRKIAAQMNERGYPTPSGKAIWSHKTVDYLLATRHVRELIDA
jgi:hypothetical protein